jgi:hypothetical protein
MVSARAGETDAKSTPIAAGAAERYENRLFGVQFRPINSTAGRYGNALETILPHWPPVIRHVHDFLPRTDASCRQGTQQKSRFRA